MNVQLILVSAVYIALGILILAMVLTSVRVILGPTVADRVLALDQLVAIAIGFIAVIAIKTGYALYIDIALALGLVGFIATVAFARYIYFTGKPSDAMTGAADDNEGEQR